MDEKRRHTSRSTRQRQSQHRPDTDHRTRDPKITRLVQMTLLPSKPGIRAVHVQDDGDADDLQNGVNAHEYGYDFPAAATAFGADFA